MQLDVLSEIKQLAYRAKESASKGAFDELGEILHQGWKLKVTLASGIANSEIIEIYEVGRRAGAIGGKLVGAGGGGFLLFYCKKEKQDDVRKALRGLRELPFRLEKDGSKVIFNYRR